MPFYLRTGKRLPQRVTEIAIQFKRAPFMLFRKTSVERLTPNLLVLHIQPDEGISLRFGAKMPGPLVRLGSVNMDFRYADYFGSTPSTGYERLLYDCMMGDATLFQRADMVEAVVERGDADSGRLESPATAQLPELCGRHLGTEGGGRADRTGRATVEEDQRMILAGDIGGTNSRLAFFSERGGRLEPVVEATYPSRDHANLETIVKKFVSAHDLPIDVACFGVAGPVQTWT